MYFGFSLSNNHSLRSKFVTTISLKMFNKKKDEFMFHSKNETKNSTPFQII